MKTLLILLLTPVGLAVGQTEYGSTTLPEALKENAHAVMRRHELTYAVKSPGEATQRLRQVITVLDEQGDEYAKHVVGYDKLSTVLDFTGALYDADGKLIRRLKKADITDQSAQSDYTLFDDQRYKSAAFPKQPAYPYTVEFVVETGERNLMFYPTWMPQDDEHLSVEQSTFTVQMPAGLALRHKAVNLSVPPTETARPDGGKTYVWTLANQPAVVFEPLHPPVREMMPIVYTAPATFELQRYTGNLTSWRELGRFYHTLNTGRNQLPPALQQQVLDLVKTEKTTAGKVARVYRYLQDNTRYVGIQLGIGGWQTIEAEQVALSKYGDCKALTNFAQGMLAAVGVPAYPVLVRAGSGQPALMADFPSFQFNHVVLCVPDGRDTTFLECTSGHNAPGYMGDFTGGRQALLVLPDGGRLIRMPDYRAADNRQQRSITATITPEGDADAAIRTRYTGLQQDTYAEVMHSLSRDDQRAWLIKRISLPTFDLTTFGYAEQPGRVPAIVETIALRARRWATASGSRLMLPLNLLSAQGNVTPVVGTRKMPVHMDDSYEYDDRDTVVYQLPKGYTPEFRMEPIRISSAFGDYAAEAVIEGDRVRYYRHMRMHGGRYPATAYADWATFRRKVARADRAQLVFVKTD